MKHGRPKGTRKEKPVAVQWEDKPEDLTSAELEALSEDDRLRYWAHVSVNAADRAQAYTLYGALAFCGALLLVVIALAAIVWGKW